MSEAHTWRIQSIMKTWQSANCDVFIPSSRAGSIYIY